MKIIVDIPDGIYKQYMDDRVRVTDVLHAVRHGTPISEPHGRIIDESQIRHIVCHTERELYGDKIRYVKATDAPTIIEGSEDNACLDEGNTR